MSLRAIPMLFFSFILYNLIVMSMGVEALQTPIFTVTLVEQGLRGPLRGAISSCW